MKNFLGPIYAVLAALGFGLTIPATKVAVDNLPLAFYQTGIAVVAIFFLIPFYFLQNKKSWHFKKLWKEYLVLTLLSGIIPSVLSYYGFLYGFGVNAAVIYRFEVIVVLVLSIVYLKQKITRRQFFGILLSFVGLVIYITQFKFSFVPGDLFILAAAFSYSSFTLVAKKLHKYISTVQINISRMLLVLPLFGTMAVFNNNLLESYSLSHLAALVITGVGVFVVGASGYAAAVKYWDIWKVVFVAQFGSALFGYISSVVILGEAFSFWQGVGASIIFFSLFVVLWKPRRKLIINYE